MSLKKAPEDCSLVAQMLAESCRQQLNAVKLIPAPIFSEEIAVFGNGNGNPQQILRLPPQLFGASHMGSACEAFSKHRARIARSD